ncbi:DNA translocase FtsK [Cupriavidus sp.]|uniref:DNA translocase FtsK n=1 Tax=Cupriavidus sp. TaxID=1873897 RepID=UPI003D14EDD9
MEKFQFMGAATILHLNTRKEGPEDNQELALDLKFKAVADHRVMRFFDELLANFMFLSNGAVRNKIMGPITYGHELESYRLDMVGSTFTGVRVKKFSLEPKDGFKVWVTFSVSFKPSGDEVARVAEFLLDEIDLSLMSGDNELDFGDSTGVRTVHVESGADDELLEAARELVVNHRRASVSLIQRHLRIGYNRAARLIEALEVLGAVSEPDENGNRTVLVEEGASA